MSFKIEGLEFVGEDPDGRAITYRLRDGKPLAIVNPPKTNGEYAVETHLAAEPVRKVLTALASAEGVHRAVAADRSLSDFGRSQKVEPLRNRVREAHRESCEAVDRLEVAAADLRRQILEPPKLDRSDIPGALLDQEIRAHCRSLRGKNLTEFAQSLETANVDQVAAILRSPVPIRVLTDAAQRRWGEHVMASHPRAPQLANYSAAIEWARGVLSHLQDRI